MGEQKRKKKGKKESRKEGKKKIKKKKNRYTDLQIDRYRYTGKWTYVYVESTVASR